MSQHTPPVHVQTVAWGDMDALGHVNNAAYFRYMESARVAFLLWLGIDRLRESGGIAVILQSAQARFRRPVKYPDTLRISTRVDAIEVTLRHELHSNALGEVAAVGHGVIVAYDYDAARKATLPGEWSRRLEAARGTP